MNTKRFLIFGILGLFSIFMMGGVLALTPGDIGAGIADFFKELITGLSGLLGTDADSGLSKFLFVILLAMIIYTVISSFFSGSNPFLKWGITISISLLFYIGIPKGYLEGLLVSYGAMGLTILTVIPFMIMVLFTIRVRNLMIARGTWIFYVLYYFVLVIGKIWETSGAKPVYWIALVGGIAMFLTIPWIRSWFAGSRLDSFLEEGEEALRGNKAVQKLSKKIDEDKVKIATGGKLPDSVTTA